jgi:hypothetical protein
MYRIVLTKDWTAKLKLGREVIAESESDTSDDLEHLRRKAEEHAEQELDWKGGSVRTLPDHHGLVVWWQAPAPVAIAA